MKICYINYSLNNPRDQITLRGLRENGVEVVEISDATRGWRKYRNISRVFHERGRPCELVMVGYAGSVLVIWMRLLTRKKIIYNTLATFYDSMVISRGDGNKYSPRAVWYWLIDFFAFHFASRTFVECKSQKDLIIKTFRIRPSKLSVHYVGTDDNQFYYDSDVPKLKTFTVVFRGMFLAEAGADVIIRAAKVLESSGIHVRLMGRGLLLRDVEDLIRQLRPTNLELITEKMSMNELRSKMLECHVSLGQLANHPRVHTTIPHKAFESMAMQLPYLTGDNKGVMEIFENNKTCFTVRPGDSAALAEKIIALRNNVSERDRVAHAAHQLYQETYTPNKLAQSMIEEIARV